MDGIITFIREAKYHPSDEEIIATMIKLYNENSYLEIDELIKEIKKDH